MVEEARRNLAETSEEYVLFLDFVLENTPVEFVRPTKRQVLTAGRHVALKDAPIVAAAKRAMGNLLDLFALFKIAYLADGKQERPWIGFEVKPQTAAGTKSVWREP